MNLITLRPAVAEDSEFAFSLKKAALGSYVAETYGWDEGEQRALHLRRFRTADIQIVLLEDQPVGLLNVHRESDCIHLRQLFILPEFQNQGIGGHLARKLLEESERKRVLIALQVLKSNPRAKAFYERLGFQLVGETETHYQMKRASKQSGQVDTGESAKIGLR